MRSIFSFFIQCRNIIPNSSIIFKSISLISILSGFTAFPAYALGTIVAVDHRVEVTFTDFKYDTKKSVYTTQLTVKNISQAPIYTPLRLSITRIDDATIRILNDNGIGPDSLAYREITLSKGVLNPEQSSTSITLEFIKDTKKQPLNVTDLRLPKKNKHIQSLPLNTPFNFAYHVSATVTQAPLEPRAEPYALETNSGKIPVRFSVRMVGHEPTSAAVILRRLDTKQEFVMNDQGKEGDLIAGDGIFGTHVIIDTSSLKANSCLSFEAYSQAKNNAARVKVASPAYPLCVTSFPTRIASSTKANVVKLADGSKALADEILLNIVPGTPESTISSLATGINAKVVGSILPLNLFQFKLAAPFNSQKLIDLINNLKTHKEIISAYPNVLGEPAYTPTDTDYPLQHGLQLIRAQDVWDIGATGSGRIVTVLDTGIDRTHPDFGTLGDCQLAENDCGSSNTDNDLTNSHGTGVAGVIAAKTNNAIGVAGIAPNSKVHSIIVSPNSFYTLAEMTQSFINASAYGLASVINASFSAGPWAGVDVTAFCASINSAVLIGITPVSIAIVASGNNNSNNYYYPARCNDSTRPEHATLTRKDLLISTANSLSSTTIDPLCSPATLVDQRCGNSNYGTWVDIAAPGMSIRTTTSGNSYAYRTGTSFSAPMVSGASAILSSCGVPLDQIESTLRTSALVTIPFPDGSSAPRLDIFRALQSLNLAPSAVLLTGGSLLENTNTAAGVEMGTLTTTDPNTCDKFTYSIVGGADMAVFSLGGAASDRLVLTAGVLDFEIKSSYAVTVRVTDFFGQTFDQPITINVTNINEAPAGSNATITINEDAVHTFAAANFGFSDPSDLPTPNNLSAVIISTLPSTGTLALSAVPIVAGQTIPVASIGNVTFTPAANANGNGYASFTFQVVDDGGTANGGINTDPAPNTLTFNVTPVNDLPTGVLSFTGTLTVGQTLTANTATIADADGLGVFNYQWRRGGVDIPGATSSTYTLVPADFGTVANLHVSYTDGGGTVENLDTSNASNTGDPHINAVDGLHFDFQAAGEFVALRGNNGMEIQTRQTPVSTAGTLADNYSELPVGVSINTAVAARVGKHRVTLQPGFNASDLVLRIDGVRTTLPASGIDLGSGGRVVGIAGGAYQIDFPDTTTLVVTPGFWSPHNVWYLNVAVFHTPAHEGIMGIREKGGWLPKLSDGSSLGARPVALHDRYVDLYEKFASSWRVTNESSLFDYARHTSTKTFTLKDWPRENPPHVIPQGGRVTKPLKREIALEHCRAVAGKNNQADCVFDVMVTGHAGFAKTMLFAQKIQGGLTATVVREDKDNERPNRNLRFTAMVIKHAPAMALVTDGKDTSAKAVENSTAPSGFIQFMLNGRNIGKPVKLDSPGQAILNIPRDKVGAAQIGARYLPAKGSIFLPSSSSNLSNSLDELKMRSRVLKETKQIPPTPPL